MSVQYGGTLRCVDGRKIVITRDGSETCIESANSEPLLTMSYPQLMALITRLQEAAKEAARAPVKHRPGEDPEHCPF